MILIPSRYFPRVLLAPSHFCRADDKGLVSTVVSTVLCSMTLRLSGLTPQYDVGGWILLFSLFCCFQSTIGRQRGWINWLEADRWWQQMPGGVMGEKTKDSGMTPRPLRNDEHPVCLFGNGGEAEDKKNSGLEHGQTLTRLTPPSVLHLHASTSALPPERDLPDWANSSFLLARLTNMFQKLHHPPDIRHGPFSITMLRANTFMHMLTAECSCKKRREGKTRQDKTRSRAFTHSGTALFTAATTLEDAHKKEKKEKGSSMHIASKRPQLSDAPCSGQGWH